jgi:sugar phosphate isomerase/epimerase
MKTGQIAVQLYTLREYCKTPADIAATLAKVRKMGYQAVQVSGVAPIEETELKKMLDGEGLVCAATHEGTGAILNETDKVIERLRKLNCRYTAIPHPGKLDFSNRDVVMDFIRKADAAGKKMREAGQALTYHNHSIEFCKLDGKTILELIYANTGADNLQGEIDTYWVQHGGGDSVAWCRKLKGRLPLLHLKDYIIAGPENKPRFAEIGHGNLNIPEIVKAADESGCKWFMVEQDDCYERNPFESLEMSFKYLQTLAAKG